MFEDVIGLILFFVDGITIASYVTGSVTFSDVAASSPTEHSGSSTILPPAIRSVDKLLALTIRLMAPGYYARFNPFSVESLLPCSVKWRYKKALQPKHHRYLKSP